MRSTLHSISARALIVVASAYTSALQLFSTTSLAYRAAGDSVLIDAVNWVVLSLAGLAGADLIWRDILRRGMIFPKFDAHRRHHICVATYSMLASAFAVRAFIASGGDVGTVFQVGGYYLLMAAGIAVEAAAIAQEERTNTTCRTHSENV
jgi:hypothetical protein